MVPQYKVGRCLNCKKDVFLPEDSAAHFMKRQREIEAARYTILVFGYYLLIWLYEESTPQDCKHTVRFKAIYDNNNFIQYIKDNDIPT
mgnify:CR=1 FL=1